MDVQLLLGCGRRREKVLVPPDCKREFTDCIALDVDPSARISGDQFVICDLDSLHWRFSKWFLPPRSLPLLERASELNEEIHRFKSDVFSEIHAYEVFEHLGRQGDYVSFFAHFSECWRMLKPGGFLCVTVPSRFSPWLWADPGHRRAVVPESLIFLSQPYYTADDRGPMSDYRESAHYRADFDITYANDNRMHFGFILTAVKPSRYEGSHP